MKTILPTTISTKEEAVDFFRNLYINGEAFHPDDDANDLSGDPFTKEEGDKLNNLIEQISNIDPNFDYYEPLCDFNRIQLRATDRMVMFNDVPLYYNPEIDPECATDEQVLSNENLVDAFEDLSNIDNLFMYRGWVYYTIKGEMQFSMDYSNQSVEYDTRDEMEQFIFVTSLNY